MPRKSLIQLAMAVVMCAIAAVANGHRGHGMWSEITWADDRFEITHRLHLSDAIQTLRLLDMSASIDELSGQALLAIYVEKNFGVSDPKHATSLTTLGAEISDDFFYVYQEWLTDLPQDMPFFWSKVLSDVVKESHSWIYYEVPGFTQTVELQSND